MIKICDKGIAYTYTFPEDMLYVMNATQQIK
jgi:hypothetical protein